MSEEKKIKELREIAKKSVAFLGMPPSEDEDESSKEEIEIIFTQPLTQEEKEFWVRETATKAEDFD